MDRFWRCCRRRCAGYRAAIHHTSWRSHSTRTWSSSQKDAGVGGDETPGRAGDRSSVSQNAGLCKRWLALPSAVETRALTQEGVMTLTSLSAVGAAAVGQSGQRRTLSQHGPSGLRAVAGAASATSAAAGSPPRKRTSHRRRGRPRPGRGMSAFALAGPARPDGTKAIEGHPRPHTRACVWRPSARLGDVPR